MASSSSPSSSAATATTAAAPQVITLQGAQCPVQTVTVYSDRAEVARIVSFDASTANCEYEIHVTGLSNKIDRDSVHVSGGQGHATILEVLSKTSFEIDQQQRSDNVKRQLKIKELQEEQAKLNDALSANTKATSWLNNLADSLTATPVKCAKEPHQFLGPEDLEKIAKFTLFYSTQLKERAQEAAGITKKINELRESIDQLRKEGNLSMRAADDSSAVAKERRTVVISLMVTEPGKISIQLAYVVNGAKWNPTYDCRVESASAKVQLTYRGVISNNTDEDWIDCHLYLSTAAPSSGGAPPTLPTATVGFPQPISSRASPSRRERRASVEFNEMLQCQSMALPMQMEEGGGAPGGGSRSAAAAPPVAVLVTKANESMASTSFEIPRVATIQSDNQEHKVTIAVIDLTANLSYTTVPRLSEFAFVKASTKNTSPFPLLPGPCSVFIDTNFITSSPLPYTAAGENFVLYLGTDKSVRIEYKPFSTVKDQQGLFTKSNVERYSCSISVKNTKAQEITVVAYESLPLSNNEQIKVTLLEPELNKPHPNVVLNPKNNLEWRTRLAPDKSDSLTIRFQIEWPKDKQVSVTWA